MIHIIFIFPQKAQNTTFPISESPCAAVFARTQSGHSSARAYSETRRLRGGRLRILAFAALETSGGRTAVAPIHMGGK